MAALCVHQHRVDEFGLFFPLKPLTLGSAREIAARFPFNHQAFDVTAFIRGELFHHVLEFVQTGKWDPG